MVLPHDADDGTFAENFYQFFADLKKKNKKAVVKSVAIVGEDGLFGTGASDAEEAGAKKAGYDVATRVAYTATTTEVNSEVQKVKAAAPDVIMQASYLPDALLFMRGYKQQGVAVKAIMAQDAGFIDPGFVRRRARMRKASSRARCSRSTSSSEIKPCR